VTAGQPAARARLNKKTGQGERMSGIRSEFEAAVAQAQAALEEFNKEPLIASKRGGPRLSSWWRVYVQSSEVAARWHRQLESEEPSIDEELDRLLGPSE
jgi:hypothetical protein